MDVLTRKGWRTIQHDLRSRKLEGDQIADGSISENHLSATLGGDLDTFAEAIDDLEVVVYDVDEGVVATATKLTSLYAAGPAGSAETKIRFASTAATTGASASIAMQVSANSTFNNVKAAMFLDAMSDGTAQIRFEANDVIFTVSKFKILRPQGGAVPVFSIDTSTNPDTIELNGNVAINGGLIVGESITGAKIRDGAILARHIVAGAITADKIQAGTISVDKLQVAGTIYRPLVGAKVFTANKAFVLIASASLYLDAFTKVLLASLSITTTTTSSGSNSNPPPGSVTFTWRLRAGSTIMATGSLGSFDTFASVGQTKVSTRVATLLKGIPPGKVPNTSQVIILDVAANVTNTRVSCNFRVDGFVLAPRA